MLNLLSAVNQSRRKSNKFTGTKWQFHKLLNGDRPITIY